MSCVFCVLLSCMTGAELRLRDALSWLFWACLRHAFVCIYSVCAVRRVQVYVCFTAFGLGHAHF